MTNSANLRQLLEAHLETAIPHEQWSRFEENHPKALGDYFSQREDEGPGVALSYLATAFEGFDAGRRRPRARNSIKPELPPDPRWEALSAILTIRARRDPDVVSFRRSVMRDQLIRLDDVPTWIKEAAEADGQPTAFTPDHETEFPWSRAEVIQYVASYTRRPWLVLSRAIRVEGVLYQLRQLARRLSQGFGWPERWMVSFILTDESPPEPRLIEYELHERPYDVPTLAWAELRINPLGVSPRELERLYAQIRTQGFSVSRVDALKKKAVALAVHWEGNRDLAVAESRRRWNEAHPEWAYPDPTGNFGRDSRAAWSQVTGEEAE